MASKSGFFEKYAIVAMQIDNVTFYVCKIIKVTSGSNLKKTFFSQGGATIQKNSSTNSTTLTPLGPPWVFTEAKLSTELEFGSLVC